MKRIVVFLLALVMVGCSVQPGPSATKDKGQPPRSSIEENEKATDDHDQQKQVAQKPQTAKHDKEKIKDKDSPERDHPQYELNVDQQIIEPIDQANKKVVLLTIDDAPDQHALEMAKTLHDLDVKAIFFVNGHFLKGNKTNQNVLREIHDLGFPIGNHTMTHNDLTTLSEDKQREEIEGVNTLVEEAIGEKPQFFRAPFGKNTDFTLQLAHEAHMLPMNWTYGYDWEQAYQNKDALTDVMLGSDYLHNGAILLMHDRAWTNEALKDIVTGLQEKGYDIVDPDLIKVPEQ